MNLGSALELLQMAADQRVLFIGETILDVYNYVTPLARPAKEVILSVQQQRKEIYQGGIVAAAMHAAKICRKVSVHSDRMITKTRYLVENVYVHKLFQVYDGMELKEAALPVNFQEFDTIAVIDYGHGMMNDDVLVMLQDESPFLAVNVQANSGNYGFNLATKYDTCDYLVVDELEARLATMNQFGPIEQSVEELSSISNKVIVTLGRQGAIGWTRETGCVRVPTHSTKIVDTIGAGDAFFAVTAPLAEAGDIHDLMVLGNAAGALTAAQIGNSYVVTKEDIVEHLASIP